MKTAEATLLMSTGAITEAVLYRSGEGWELWLHGDRVPSSTRNSVELARGGGRRTWKTLDAAYGWLCSLPGADGVQVRLEHMQWSG